MGMNDFFVSQVPYRGLVDSNREAVESYVKVRVYACANNSLTRPDIICRAC